MWIEPEEPEYSGCQAYQLILEEERDVNEELSKRDEEIKKALMDNLSIISLKFRTSTQQLGVSEDEMLPKTAQEVETSNW